MRAVHVRARARAIARGVHARVKGVIARSSEDTTTPAGESSIVSRKPLANIRQKRPDEIARRSLDRRAHRDGME